MADTLQSYETGLTRLLEHLGSGHPRYAKALTLQARLLENIAQAGRYGDTETRRAERAQIVEALNQLALEEIGKSFNELCVPPAPPEPTTKKPPAKIPRRPWGLLALLLLDFCLVILWGWCLFGDQPNLIAYLGTVFTIVAVPIAVLVSIFVVRRPVVLEDVLCRLGTDQGWARVILGLSGLIIVITFMFWPLGWVGKCVPPPTSTPTPTPTAIPSGTPSPTPTPTHTNTPTLSAMPTQTPTDTLTTTLTHTPANTPTHTPTNTPTLTPTNTPPPPPPTPTLPPPPPTPTPQPPPPPTPTDTPPKPTRLPR